MRRARSSAHAALLVAVAIGGSASGARAVPVPPPKDPPLLVYPGQPLASNGGLLVLGGALVTMTPAGSSEPSVTGITDDSVGRFAIWRPDAPLAPGLYDLLLEVPPATRSFSSAPPITQTTLRVVDAVTLGAPEVAVSAVLEQRQTPLVEECCRLLRPGPSVCTATRLRSDAAIRVELTSSAPPEVMGQYLFRVVAPSAVSAATPSPAGYEPLSTVFSLTFEEPAAEYCFQLDAFEAATLTEHLALPVTTACFEHQGEMMPAIREVPIDDGFLDHLVCPIPPAGHEARWCLLNEAACDAPDAGASCAGYGHVCRGEPFPFPDVAGAGGAGGESGAGMTVAGGAGGLGGASGAGSVSGAGGAGGDSFENDIHGEPRERGGACSARPARTGSSALGSLALAAIVLGLSRPSRRTRSRAARSSPVGRSAGRAPAARARAARRS